MLLASLLGAFVASTLVDDRLASGDGGYRSLSGAALGLVGGWVRRDMAENEEFEKNVAARATSATAAGSSNDSVAAAIALVATLTLPETTGLVHRRPGHSAS